MPIQLCFLRTFVKKMLPPGAIFKLKYTKMRTAGASPRTPLGKLQSSPRPIQLLFRDPLRGRGGEEKKGKEKEGKEEKVRG